MIIPRLARHLARLEELSVGLAFSRSLTEARELGKPLAEAMADIELDVVVWRRLHLPFDTDFVALYPIALRALHNLERVYEEEPRTLTRVGHVRAVLEGTAPTYFESK